MHSAARYIGAGVLTGCSLAAAAAALEPDYVLLRLDFEDAVFVRADLAARHPARCRGAQAVGCSSAPGCRPSDVFREVCSGA